MLFELLHRARYYVESVAASNMLLGQECCYIECDAESSMLLRRVRYLDEYVATYLACYVECLATSMVLLRLLCCCNSVELCCSVLQHTATHCNTLRLLCCCNSIELCCSVLQHTATHCNTLQHTATRYVFCVAAILLSSAINATSLLLHLVCCYIPTSIILLSIVFLRSNVYVLLPSVLLRLVRCCLRCC